MVTGENMTTYYFSAATNGFYNSDDHQVVPDDAIEISKELLEDLVTGNATGLVVAAGVDGTPICVTQESLLSDDEVAAGLRQKRDVLLAGSDWVSLRANDTGTAVPTEWLVYRSGLRDLPTQSGWPRNVTWPELPDN
ncbi:hypothetical protein D3C77_155890 [compost metagenome]